MEDLSQLSPGYSDELVTYLGSLRDDRCETIANTWDILSCHHNNVPPFGSESPFSSVSVHHRDHDTSFASRLQTVRPGSHPIPSHRIASRFLISCIMDGGRLWDASHLTSSDTHHHHRRGEVGWSDLHTPQIDGLAVILLNSQFVLDICWSCDWSHVYLTSRGRRLARRRSDRPCGYDRYDDVIRVVHHVGRATIVSSRHFSSFLITSLLFAYMGRFGCLEL